MDFKFSEDEERFRESVKEFGERYIAPKWIEIDEKAEISIDLIKKMGEQELFAIPVKGEYGGADGNITLAAIAAEEVAYYDPSVALAVFTLLVNGWPLALQEFGSEEAKQEILPKVASGDAFYGIATTEPTGGSDIAATRTTAKQNGGKWIVNGEKAYISGVDEVLRLPSGGGWFFIARTGTPQQGHRTLTAFSLLGRWNGQKSEGFDPSIYEEIGRHGISTGSFKLSEFEVDDKYRMGEINRGFYLVMQGFNVARILVSAATLGTSRWALDQAAKWFKERKLFGRYVSSFQGVNFKFAELYAELELARLAVYKAAWMADKIYIEHDPKYKPQDLNLPVSIAKMKGPETATRIYEEVLKWHGAYGYVKESNIFRGWLGAFSYVIGAEGAQNIMRYIIAREVLGSKYVRG